MNQPLGLEAKSCGDGSNADCPRLVLLRQDCNSLAPESAPRKTALTRGHIAHCTWLALNNPPKGGKNCVLGLCMCPFLVQKQ